MSNHTDELKVYTGKETLQALIDRKTLSWATDQYKLEGEFLYEKNGPNEWTRSFRSLDHFMTNEFTEVVAPQVGDWVKVTEKADRTHKVAQIVRIADGTKLYANWSPECGKETYYYADSEYITWEILSPEQVSEYKREQAFTKVGRKLNEFRSGDIVYIDCLDTVATVITKRNEANSIIKLHGINEVGKGYDASAHQLTPISFIEQQVDLS
ncbi:hypothetical protein A6E27_23085 [Bacillus cereus]|nr:hypothetical protein A6E27_23085 [Bacillus cereus]